MLVKVLSFLVRSSENDETWTTTTIKRFALLFSRVLRRKVHSSSRTGGEDHARARRHISSFYGDDDDEVGENVC